MNTYVAEPELTVYPYWTVELLHKIPQVEGERYELINGELHVTTQPHTRHQAACHKIAFYLELWSSKRNRGVVLPAPGVIYSQREGVAPDVVWVSAARLPEILGDDGKLHGSPDLVIELLSPGKANEERDREIKLDLYSRRGVQEYWIADWRTTSLEIYRQKDAALQLVKKVGAGETVRSPLLRGVSCLLDRFFEF